MEITEVEGITQYSVAPGLRLRLRCPACLHEGTLDQRGTDLRVSGNRTPFGDLISGQRTCPNPECRALLFVIYHESSGEVVVTYPPERIDFDASALPESVQRPLEEAIECHAHDSYRAAAVMVRRTLEAVCADQGAKGRNLSDRIDSLGKQIVLPKGMIDSLHNLRLLGNDAAHVEAKTYEDVDELEVEVAIKVAKEILRATYQMESILGELESLKGSASESTS